MKPVIGLLLVFTGLAIGYMVITGKLPSGQTPTGSQSGTTNAQGAAAAHQAVVNLQKSLFPASTGTVGQNMA